MAGNNSAGVVRVISMVRMMCSTKAQKELSQLTLLILEWDRQDNIHGIPEQHNMESLSD